MAMSGDPNLSLVIEAKKCKYTLIPKTITCDEVLQIWTTASAFVIRRLLERKAVNFPGIGLFSILRRKIDIGNNGKLCVQRPVFMLSEKFAQTHGVIYTKYKPAGQTPVVQLNYTALAMETGMDKDVVEVSVKEVLATFARIVHIKRNGELTFKDVGKLVIKNGKAKMKFSKDFLKIMDGTQPARLSPLPLGRLRTSDTFISQNSIMTASTVDSDDGKKFVLPKIKSNDNGHERPISVIGTNDEELVLSPIPTDNNEFDKESETEEFLAVNLPALEKKDGLEEEKETIERCEILPLETVNTKTFSCEQPTETRRKTTDLKPTETKSSETETKADECSKTKPENDEKEGVVTKKAVSFDKSKCSNKEGASNRCCHQSGQELCYLCHQRQKRNIPIYFDEERKRQEQEQDRVLQKYQQFRDQEFNEAETNYLKAERQVSKEVAQFNLAVSERAKAEKALPSKFHRSYIFMNRSDSPQYYMTRENYRTQLGDQLAKKEAHVSRLRNETAALEEKEQRYLAAELKRTQRQQHLDKAAAKKVYASALQCQIQNQPFQLPPAEPDSEGSVFGKLDMTPEKCIAARTRAKDVLNHQLKTMRENKEKKRLMKEQTRNDEMNVLNRTKQELREEFQRRSNISKGLRKGLEKSWTRQHADKKRQDKLDKRHQMTAGLLLLDQCDKYKRCTQCERCLKNAGQTNIWPESRYLSGSRLMI